MPEYVDILQFIITGRFGELKIGDSYKTVLEFLGDCREIYKDKPARNSSEVDLTTCVPKEMLEETVATLAGDWLRLRYGGLVVWIEDGHVQSFSLVNQSGFPYISDRVQLITRELDWTNLDCNGFQELCNASGIRYFYQRYQEHACAFSCESQANVAVLFEGHAEQAVGNMRFRAILVG